MRQKEIFKKIGIIIEELSDHYDYLKLSENNLNDIELELFVANAHFLTDHVEILCKLNVQNQNIIPAPETNDQKTAQKFFEPVVQQLKRDTGPIEEKPAEPPLLREPEKFYITPEPDKPVANENKPVEDFNFKPVISVDLYPEEQQADEDLTPKDIADDEPMPATGYNDTGYEVFKAAETTVYDWPDVSQTEAVQLEERTEEVPVRTPVAGIIQDTPGDGALVTINQKMSSQFAQKPPAEAEQVTGPPISDLKHGITLNDKLLYVRDLFNGYNLAYSEAIEILNRFSSFDEAMRFLKTNYVAKNNWEGKPGTTEKFYALLKRRYGS
jgi:hypothetical protein